MPVGLSSEGSPLKSPVYTTRPWESYSPLVGRMYLKNMVNMNEIIHFARVEAAFGRFERLVESLSLLTRLQSYQRLKYMEFKRISRSG